MSSKYDIFGGKPLSRSSYTGAFNDPTVAQLIQSMQNPRGSPSSHGQSVLSAYHTAQSKGGAVKSYTNGVLTGAWKRVVYHFFVNKQVKVAGDDGYSSTKVDKVYHFRDRKGASKSLNSIAYFKARHPKLYSRYMKFFPVLQQGGVVFNVNGQLGFVQRSKFNRYSAAEQAAILGFLSFAHYSNKGNPRSTAALARNRADSRYGPERQRVLTALAQARKLYKAGKLNVSTLPRVSGNGVSTQDVVDGSRLKVSYRGLSAAEKTARQNEVKAMKKSIVQLLVSNPPLVQAIEQQSSTLKAATASRRAADKGSRLRAAIQLVQSSLTPAALSSASLAKGDSIFVNAENLSYAQKTKIRKLANAIKLRAAAVNGKVARGTRLNLSVADAIARTRTGGGRYAFDDDDFDDDFIGGGSSFTFDDEEDSDEYIGGGRRDSRRKDKKDNYIWFV
jgi:hypothetical protein